MNWMDVAIVVILGVYSLKGWGKGLVLSLFGIVGYIVAGFVAKKYSPVVSAYIIDHPELSGKIQGFVNGRLQVAVQADAVPDSIVRNRNIFQVLRFPKGLEEFMMKSDMVQEYSDKAMDGIHSYISEVLTKLLIEFMSFLLVLFAALLIVYVLGHLLNSIASLPLLNQANRIAGACLGMMKGLLIIFLILAVITPIATMTDYGIIMEGLEKSMLASYLYDHNPILGLIEGIFTVG
ncbi:MAG: CvpA family protein [Bacillota bacterium]